MSDAPFAQKQVLRGERTPEAQAARRRLQTVLDQLNPAAEAVKIRK
jgi:hypothetical protein